MNSMEHVRPRPQTVPEAIVRTLRHEVGDLLQTVYAAVAILKERLPADCQTESPPVSIDIHSGGVVSTSTHAPSIHAWAQACASRDRTSQRCSIVLHSCAAYPTSPGSWIAWRSPA